MVLALLQVVSFEGTIPALPSRIGWNHHVLTGRKPHTASMLYVGRNWITDDSFVKVHHILVFLVVRLIASDLERGRTGYMFGELHKCVKHTCSEFSAFGQPRAPINLHSERLDWSRMPPLRRGSLGHPILNCDIPHLLHLRRSQWLKSSMNVFTVGIPVGPSCQLEDLKATDRSRIAWSNCDTVKLLGQRP